MDILITIVCAVIVLSVLVFLHEGGHFITAKMFGVRVSEFMLGLPGPNLSFKYKGTKFGVTCIPLGGYARVCGMEPGNLKPYIKEVLHFSYNNGTVSAKRVSDALRISYEEAEEALDELCEWFSLIRETKKDNSKLEHELYYTPESKKNKKGQIVPLKDNDIDSFFQQEYFCQYRSLPFWKRSIILLAGIIVNLLFAMIIFVILYTIIGFDLQNKQTGEILHKTLNPIESIQYGFTYIWAVIQAVIKLFNPVTTQETIQNSTSLIGIAVISKSAAEQGVCAFLEFMAMISVSLGIMNLLPIPPLDGGKFIIEIIQKIIRRNVSEKVTTAMSLIGIFLFIALFVVMMGQDIQRFIIK